MRGEYPAARRCLRFRLELPPRARRIHIWPNPLTPAAGTTSACAENTLATLDRVVSKGNYLRVRGEYLGAKDRKAGDVELPPRARRIQTRAVGFVVELVNYLRVRGEYPTHATHQVPQSELPPRARRIQGRPGA